MITKTKARFGGLVIAAVLLLGGASAQAQTTAELQAQIAALMAQLAALQGPTVTHTFTMNLTIGSTGPEVVALQTFLESKGYLVMPVGVAKGYFGPLTRAAVAKFQAANGIAPAVGYFGPITRARVNSMVVVTPGGPIVVVPGTPTALQGGEGDLLVDVLTDSDVTIDLGDSELVIELELEAEDSDVAVNRVDFMFDARPWLYFDEVNLLIDGKEVASLSGSGDFTETNGDYRARFSGLNHVIREGRTADLALELVVLGSMSGDRDTHTIAVSTEDDFIRFIDGAGLTGYAGEDMTLDVDFDDTFGEGDIDVSVSDNSPEALQIVLNETSRTNGVEVARFNVEAEDSDIEITDVTVVFDSNGTDVPNTLYRAYLYRGSTLLKQVGVTGTTTTTFDDLDHMIDEDDEEEFTVKVDFNRGDSLDLPATFTVVSIEVDGENADFDAVNDSVTVDEDHTLIIDGAILEIVSKNAVATINNTTADDSYGTYTMRFEVTAVGEDVYIPLTAVRNASSTVGAAFQIEDSNGAAVTSAGTTTQSLVRTSGGSSTSLNGTNYAKINEGSSATFELVVTYNPATAGQFRLQLLTSGFSSDTLSVPTDTAAATPEADFETSNLFINS